ncbi:MAG: hypothetical protein ACRERD_08745 [Candidatus Binatia bacterium]
MPDAMEEKHCTLCGGRARTLTQLSPDEIAQRDLQPLLAEHQLCERCIDMLEPVSAVDLETFAEHEQMILEEILNEEEEK